MRCNVVQGLSCITLQCIFQRKCPKSRAVSKNPLASGLKDLCDCAISAQPESTIFPAVILLETWQGLAARNACRKHFHAVSCIQEIKIRSWRGRRDGQNQCADPIDGVQNKYSHNLILIPSQLLGDGGWSHEKDRGWENKGRLCQSQMKKKVLWYAGNPIHALCFCHMWEHQGYKMFAWEEDWSCSINSDSTTFKEKLHLAWISRWWPVILIQSFIYLQVSCSLSCSGSWWVWRTLWNDCTLNEMSVHHRSPQTFIPEGMFRLWPHWHILDVLVWVVRNAHHVSSLAFWSVFFFLVIVAVCPTSLCSLTRFVTWTFSRRKRTELRLQITPRHEHRWPCCLR